MQTIKVDGMRCGHCSSAVQKALEEAKAVNVSVNLEKKEVQYDGELDPSKAKEIIDDLGFVANI